MTLVTSGHPFAYEMECIVRMFYPGTKITTEDTDRGQDGAVITSITEEPDALCLTAAFRLGDFDKQSDVNLTPDFPQGERERVLAVLLFGLLKEKTGIRPSWGILTGVRPVRLIRAWMENGMSQDAVSRRLLSDYLVLPEKAALALRTAANQEHILKENRPRDFSLYVSIPFCPSRCSYCSFVSHEIEKCHKLIPDYMGLLKEELRQTAGIARDLGLRLCSIYIGGGTPTVLDASQLRELLETVGECFAVPALSEFTVEAGRPDTIDPEKLKVLRDCSVNRISINPQTMDDTILGAIGRKHTADQVMQSFRQAREAGFSRINMDLIAGLPGDDGSRLAESVEKVLELSPENITLHCLTVKRSSGLRMQDSVYEAGPGLENALAAAHIKLEGSGYRPFYLYRQKGTRQNLENTGFAKPGFESPYNVFIMEESQTVLAVGAGAVTKLCRPGKIERVYNFKYPYEYIARYGEQRARKAAIINFYTKK